MSYTTTIGLEVHAELKTVSKMFCGCKNDPHGSEPNTHICPVCLAHPGSLPVPNEQAIKMLLIFGQAVTATVAKYSEFDRKNYFYPDIPKAYQISQYAYPFLSGGSLREVALTRVHLEEDTARSQHDKGKDSVVDFNRAGVPLMELVTEPVIHDAKTAGSFARELQLLLRTLDISDANMERGEMRVEANISVSQDENVLGTKVEVKNLNSFRAVEAAIDYETSRQIELLESGKEIVQETRGWDESKSRTFTQRAKETAKDYRYFPDPDIPKIDIAQHANYDATRLAEKMPILPENKRISYANLGLPISLYELIIGDSRLDTFFFELMKLENFDKTTAPLAANYLVSDVLAQLAKGYDIGTLKPAHYNELIIMLSQNQINSRVAKDLLPDIFGATFSPRELATERNLLQVSDESSLRLVVDKVLADNGAVVAEYKGGKESSLQFLVGQGMKASRGAANPERLKSLLIEAMK